MNAFIRMGQILDRLLKAKAIDPDTGWDAQLASQIASGFTEIARAAERAINTLDAIESGEAVVSDVQADIDLIRETADGVEAALEGMEI